MVLTLNEGYGVIEHSLYTDNNPYADTIFNRRKKLRVWIFFGITVLIVIEFFMLFRNFK